MTGSWRSASFDDLQSYIRESEPRMNEREAQFWAITRILPTKWACSPYGDEGGGFWVVAVFGNQVVWYNDIEDGFNCSRYSDYGAIDGYVCEQGDLRDAIYSVLTAHEGELAGRSGAPSPVPTG